MSDKQRGMLDAILRQVPGFRGYIDQEDRRESDQKTRDLMSQRLERGKRGLDHYTGALADAARIDDIPLCEALRRRVDQALARIRSAVPGHSGLFAARRIDEDRLEDVYDCDAWLLDEVDALAVGLERLRETSDPPSRVVPGLMDKLAAIENKLDEREKLLKRLVPGD